MIYKAKNIDIDKAEEYLKSCINISTNKETLERAKIQQYYEGYRDGIEEAIHMFYCSNYEKVESEGNLC